MNISKSFGMGFGIMVGLLLCVLIFKYVNTNHKVKTEYDERQQAIRGKGYTIAFYAAIIMEAVLLVLSIGNVPLFIEPYMAHAAVIFLSCTVLCCYTVWNGAYWGLNNNHKRYYIILAAAFILNAFPVIMTAVNGGGLIENGKTSPVCISLFAALMLIVIGIVMLVRDILDRKAEKE